MTPKFDWRDAVVMSALIAVILVGLFYPFDVSGQPIEIHSGIDTYQRELPQTIQNGQELSAGLAGTLNAVIQAWEAENADAVNKVKAIMDGNQIALKSSRQAQGALSGLPGGLLAKTLAVGVYGAGSPLRAIGGPYAAGGASVTWNVWNLFELNGRAGVAWSPQIHPEVSLAAEWWLF